MITKITTERFTVKSSRPFDDVVTALESQVGHPEFEKLMSGIGASRTYEEMSALIEQFVGPTDLMEFLRFDMGGIIGKGKPGRQPKSIRFLIGNPLTMRKMAEHVADAATYAPITVLIDERGDGVHLSYDRMSSSLAPYGNAAALAVAESLDHNVEGVLIRAAGGAE